MTDGETQPVYERGDIVYGADPFKGDDAGRPWLVISNHADRPFHGEQYLVVTLTTKSWLDGLVEIPDPGGSKEGPRQTIGSSRGAYSRSITTMSRSGRVG